jgi:hypothetical protein
MQAVMDSNVSQAMNGHMHADIRIAALNLPALTDTESSGSRDDGESTERIAC